MSVGYSPGLDLPEPCPAVRHGTHPGVYIESNEFDPQCQTCSARKILRGDHDHLHLSGEVCNTPGLRGAPGRMVKCKCGGYHH